MENNITGKELANLLFKIHSHHPVTEEIIYKEKDLLKLFKKLGFPDPDWGDPYVGDTLPERIYFYKTIIDEPILLTDIEIIDFIRRDKPFKLYHTCHSESIQLYEIIEYHRAGVVILGTNWSNKTPEFMTWDELYNLLKIQGLKNFFYEI